MCTFEKLHLQMECNIIKGLYESIVVGFYWLIDVYIGWHPEELAKAYVLQASDDVQQQEASTKAFTQ